VIDISFVVGVVLGTIVTGFCAIGSYNRGSDSVRRTSWTRELVARKRALVSGRGSLRSTAPVTRGALPKAS
jgi:hypothetical protein